MTPGEFVELPGLKVEVHEVIYQPKLEAPAERPHPFVYFISIINHSPDVVTIKGRKWVLHDEEGHTTVVEGDGVVGEMPRLPPGEEFSYNSYHVISSRSQVSGAFFGITGAGLPVRVSIPGFELVIPGKG